MSIKSFNLSIQADLDLLNRDVQTQRIIELVITPPAAKRKANRPSLNLALVLDRSGSMAGEKMEYTLQAALHVVELLEERDRLALVAFNSEISPVCPSTHLTVPARAELRSILRSLKPVGMTNLAGGWLTGCQFAAYAVEPGSLNRALLLTDGLANVGITDLEELGLHASQLLKRGISTTTFGVGEGYNEHLLEAMSSQGGGNFYYIANPNEIPEIFARELGELAAVTAQSVELEVVLPPHVDLQPLGGWRQENEPGKLLLSLGDIASGQQRIVFLRLMAPPVGDSATLALKFTVRAKSDTDEFYKQQAELIFQYAEKAHIQASACNRALLQRFSEAEIADAANEALKLERKGLHEQAFKKLDQTLAAASPYMDPQSAEHYRRIADNMQHGLSEEDRKSTHFAFYLRRRGRHEA